MMESIKGKDPKDEKITNRDDSVTNVDVNDPEKKEHAAQNKNEKEPTLITDNDSQGVLADESASNKGQGPSGENL